MRTWRADWYGGAFSIMINFFKRDLGSDSSPRDNMPGPRLVMKIACEWPSVHLERTWRTRIYFDNSLCGRSVLLVETKSLDELEYGGRVHHEGTELSHNNLRGAGLWGIYLCPFLVRGEGGQMRCKAGETSHTTAKRPSRAQNSLH